MNRYWMTFGRAGINSYHPGGMIKVHINKNPGSYDRDPHYPVLTEKQCMNSFWNLITEMPEADIEVIE